MEASTTMVPAAAAPAAGVARPRASSAGECRVELAGGEADRVEEPAGAGEATAAEPAEQLLCAVGHQGAADPDPQGQQAKVACVCVMDLPASGCLFKHYVPVAQECSWLGLRPG